MTSRRQLKRCKATPPRSPSSHQTWLSSLLGLFPPLLSLSSSPPSLSFIFLFFLSFSFSFRFHLIAFCLLSSPLSSSFSLFSHVFYFFSNPLLFFLPSSPSSFHLLFPPFLFSFLSSFLLFSPLSSFPLLLSPFLSSPLPNLKQALCTALSPCLTLLIDSQSIHRYKLKNGKDSFVNGSLINGSSVIMVIREIGQHRTEDIIIQNLASAFVAFCSYHYVTYITCNAATRAHT